MKDYNMQMGFGVGTWMAGILVAVTGLNVSGGIVTMWIGTVIIGITAWLRQRERKRWSAEQSQNLGRKP